MIKSRLPALIFALLFLGYGVVAQDIQLDFWASEELFTAQTFPTLIAICGGLLSFLLLLSPGPADSSIRLSALNLWPVFLLLALMLGYSLLLETLGFILASSLLLILAFMVLGERRPLLLLAVSLPLVLGLYLLLNALDIHLEAGILGALL